MTLDPRHVEARYRWIAWIVSIVLACAVVVFPIGRIAYNHMVAHRPVRIRADSQWGHPPNVWLCGSEDWLAGAATAGKEVRDAETGLSCENVTCSFPVAEKMYYSGSLAREEIYQKPMEYMKCLEFQINRSEVLIGPDHKRRGFIHDFCITAAAPASMESGAGRGRTWSFPGYTMMYTFHGGGVDSDHRMVGVLPSNQNSIVTISKSVSSWDMGYEKTSVELTDVFSRPAQPWPQVAVQENLEDILQHGPLDSQSFHNLTSAVVGFRVYIQITQLAVVETVTLGALPQLIDNLSTVGGLFSVFGLVVSFMFVRKFPRSSPVLAQETLTLRGSQEYNFLTGTELDDILKE